MRAARPTHVEWTRRSFLRSAGVALFTPGGLARKGSAVAAASFDVCEKSIRELQAAMSSGHVSSARLVQLYLDRIAAFDAAGPRLNAVLAVNPNAAADARALDVERRTRGPRGPLHGIPVLLKDNYDT